MLILATQRCQMMKQKKQDPKFNETLERVFRNIEEPVKSGQSENISTGLFDGYDVDSNRCRSKENNLKAV